jgi:hypothetical protein
MTAYLAEILVYTLLGFAVFYPLFFWFSPRNKIDAGFYNFNLGMVGLLGGMAFIIAWATGMDKILLFGMAGWLSLHLILTYLYWNSEKISNIVISFSVIVGCVVFIVFAADILPASSIILIMFTGCISQSILAGVMFAMILGHWYLNVIQLPIVLLRKTTSALFILLLIRLAWNLIQFNSLAIIDQFDNTLTAYQYMTTLDGFFLGVAVFFGLLVPLVLHYFIWHTLKLQATQSATGLLYISVLAILVGDLCYNYVLFQDGLLL